DTKQWTNTAQYLRSYDAKGNELTSLIQKWADSVWTNESLDVKEFDANNLQTGHENYKWIPETPECQALHMVDVWSYENLGELKKSIITSHEFDIRNDLNSAWHQEWKVARADSVMLQHATQSMGDPEKVKITSDSASYDKSGNVIYFSTTDRN